MKHGISRIFICAIAAAASLTGASAAAAHAFPQREQPPVGSVVHKSPASVRIWFNAKLEALFSNIVVKDSQGNKVSGDSHVDPDSLSMIEAPLRTLPAGRYHVYWRVVARDGHRTEGDYVFTVKP